jgi:hypothetical protein
MFSGTSVAEFNLQWSHWVVDVQSKIDAKLFISCYNLNLIMKVCHQIWLLKSPQSFCSLRLATKLLGARSSNIAKRGMNYWQLGCFSRSRQLSRLNWDNLQSSV